MSRSLPDGEGYRLSSAVAGGGVPSGAWCEESKAGIRTPAPCPPKPRAQVTWCEIERGSSQGWFGHARAAVTPGMLSTGLQLGAFSTHMKTSLDGEGLGPSLRPAHLKCLKLSLRWCTASRQGTAAQAPGLWGW